MENIEEIGRFPDTFNVPKLSHEYLENQNISITGREVEPVMKTVTLKETLGQVVLLLNSTKLLEN